MKIRHDLSLEFFASITGLEVDEAEKKILKRLENIVEDIPDNYGQKIKDSYGFEGKQILEVLGAINLRCIDTVTYDAYCDLTVLGDWDCPVCGGKMEVVREYGYEIESNGITPVEHVITSYDKECPICGKTMVNCND